MFRLREERIMKQIYRAQVGGCSLWNIWRTGQEWIYEIKNEKAIWYLAFDQLCLLLRGTRRGLINNFVWFVYVFRKEILRSGCGWSGWGFGWIFIVSYIITAAAGHVARSTLKIACILLAPLYFAGAVLFLFLSSHHGLFRTKIFNWNFSLFWQ